MKNKNKIYMIGVFIGLLLIYINIPLYLDLKIPYSYEADGPLIQFIAYAVVKNFIGFNFPISFIINFAGYLLLILSLTNFFVYHKRFRLAAISGGVALAAKILKVLVPFAITNDRHIIMGIIIALLIEVFANAVMIFSIGLGISKQKQVDSYMNMEVGKDFNFAVEIIVICSIIAPIVHFGVLAGIPFCTIGYGILQIALLTAVVYYILRINKYCKELKIFA